MPMAYSIGNLGVTATTTSALIASVLTTTTAGKPRTDIAAVWANVGGSAMSTAGGGYITGQTWQTVGTQTTSTVPYPKNVNYPAASNAYVNALANGAIGTGTQSVRITVGFAQTGATGFWMASHPDLALQIPNGGTVAGYADFLSRTSLASQLLNWSIDFFEQ